MSEQILTFAQRWPQVFAVPLDSYNHVIYGIHRIIDSRNHTPDGAGALPGTLLRLHGNPALHSLLRNEPRKFRLPAEKKKFIFQGFPDSVLSVEMFLTRKRERDSPNEEIVTLSSL